MAHNFKASFYSHLPAAPTADQQDLIERMERFLFREIERATYIIRGYAGTGKTTAIAALVKTLPAFHYKTVLLAPTGRAAKVMANFSKKPAFTIHKKIYQMQRGNDGRLHFALAANLHSNTLFMVDEASMISDRGSALSAAGFVQKSLLEDLITYVFSGKNCRLVLIGDIAQLPPVGSDLSPALDPSFLKANFGLNLKGVELKKVLRQAAKSGILYNATKLRDQIEEKHPTIQFETKGFQDIHRINGMELEETIENAYSTYGESNVMVISRSNKRTNAFNQQIRMRIRGQEDDVSTGDYVMVVKNNYHWLEATSTIGFIANGDIAEIMRLGNREVLYGLNFIDASLRLIDYPKQPLVEAKLLLDSLTAESPALGKEESKLFFETVMEDYADISSKKKRMELLKQNPYFNALQIKFAYAVTCHKSQGGQWKVVIVDQGYLTEEMVNKEYLRWLYTAVSRATDQLYLLNFHPHFFGEEVEVF